MANTLRKAIERAVRFFKRAEPDRPRDPYAGVRAPVRRGPPGRSSAVALPEPETDEQ